MPSWKGIIAVGLLTFLCACGGPKLSQFKDMEPKLDLQEYFTGPIKAWGLVQDYSGKVTRRFDIEMVGSWEGNVGTLEEKFHYYDGQTQERIWTITNLPNGSYEGTAGDIIGAAEGDLNGNAVRWKYEMDLPVDGRKFRVVFDDWMFLMNDGVLVNRSYIKKFGFTVAELSLFMQKQN